MCFRFLSTSLLFAATIILTACDPAASMVATKIFKAPNQVRRNGLEFQPEVQRIAQEAFSDTCKVTVRGASLQVGIIDPGIYRLDWQPRTNGQSVWIDGPMRLEVERTHNDPIGLVVVLHGFGCGKEQLLPWAFELASAGYRAALVDLRGHGASTGNWVGFGALEKEDLRLVLDALEARGSARLPVGVLGVSYGAAVGLHFAAKDPRVRTVVAMAPFASAASGIMELARALYPADASRISDRLFRSAFSIGARKASFAWTETDTMRSVTGLHQPVLFIHGGADNWISPEHSRTLHRVAQPGSRLLLVPGETHVSLPLRMEAIAGDVLSWFDSALKPAGTNTVTAGGRERVAARKDEDDGPT